MKCILYLFTLLIISIGVIYGAVINHKYWLHKRGQG